MGILQSKKIVSEGVECIAIRLEIDQARTLRDLLQNTVIENETLEQFEFREKLYYSLRDTIPPELKNDPKFENDGVVPF